jgi:subtilase family serine protease
MNKTYGIYGVNVLVVMLALLMSPVGGLSFGVGQERLAKRRDLIQRQRADPLLLHEVVVAVKLHYVDNLRDFVADVSDPDSLSYGRYLSHAAASAMLSNPTGSAAITEYFSRRDDVQMIKQTLNGEYLTYRASVSTWERLLTTEFHHFDRTNHRGSPIQHIMRCQQYTVPEAIAEHVDTIFMTSDLPPMETNSHHRGKQLTSTRNMRQSGIRSGISSNQGYVDPSLLKSYCK